VISPKSTLWPQLNADGDAGRFFRDALLYIVISETEQLLPLAHPNNLVMSLTQRLNELQGDVSPDYCRLYYRPREKALYLDVQGVRLNIDRRRPPAFLSKLDYEARPVRLISYNYRPGMKLESATLQFRELGSVDINAVKLLQEGDNEIQLAGTTGVSSYRESAIGNRHK
jgi:hypothetical protein